MTHPDIEEVLKFKTRTEFWGRKRNKSEGILQGMNEERSSKNLTVYTPEEFTIKDIQVAEPIANCLNSAKRYILNICDKLDVHEYKLYIGEGETFRERITMPIGRRYKQNRENLTRSLRIEDIKDYLVQYHDAELIYDIEVDDYLAMIGYANYKRHLAGVNPSDDMDIVIARDKDALCCEGWLFNPDNMDKPIYIQGLGAIHLNEAGKIRGTGRKFKYFQLLFGDAVDHYNPKVIPDTKVKGYGDKGIFKDLAHLETDKECWELIVRKYKEWLPEPINYQSWDNLNETDNWLTWLQKHFTLQHMRRFEGDNPQVLDILTKLGVSIDE